MVLFKFPYDFDMSNIEVLNHLMSTYKAINSDIGISSVYFAPFYQHSMSARQYGDTGPATWESYVEHIKYIIANGYTPDVLLQEPEKILEEEVIQMYLDAGVKTFTVSVDENAKTIRRLCPDAYIVASTTKVLSPKEILETDLSMYDEICLHFWYARNIKTIMELPKTHKYSIIVNALCCCTSTQCYEHWFGTSRRGSFNCTSRYNKAYSSAIDDLEYFYPYIHTFKIQGLGNRLPAFARFEWFLQQVCGEIPGPIHPYEYYYDLGVDFPVMNKDIELDTP